MSIDERAVLRALPDPVVLLDAQGCFLWANRAAEDAYGWTLERWQGRMCTELVHPDDVPSALEAMATVVDKPLGTLVEVRARTGSGEWRLVELRGRAALRDEQLGAIVLVARDITDRRRWELAAGEAAVVQAVVQHAPVIFFLLGPGRVIRSVSPALVRTLGHWAETSIGLSFDDLVHPEDRRAVALAIDDSRRGVQNDTVEARLLRRDGSPVLHQLTVTGLIDDPIVAGIVVTAHDISELERARAHLHHLATHDDLTGLPHRPALLDALTVYLLEEDEVAVIFVDLDAFKQVNDRLGHAAGDRVLQIVADRLGRAVPPPAVVGRLGGDEFLVVVAGDEAAERARRLADDVSRAVGAPINVGEADAVHVHATCGVARSRPGDGPEELVAAADAAMYRAKMA